MTSQKDATSTSPPRTGFSRWWGFVSDSPRVSWGAVFAGVVVFLALMATFSFVGSAIGLNTLTPTDDNPFKGVGTGLLIWLLLSTVISVFISSFIVGTLTRETSAVHGLITWAVGVLVFLAASTFAISSALGAAGSLVGSVASGAGSAVQAVGSAAQSALEPVADKVEESLGNIDADQVSETTQEILRDTDVPELQPEYLSDQVDRLTTEAGEMVKQVALDPDSLDEEVDKFSESLKAEAQKITDSVDREAIANAVAKNTSLTEEEAATAVDNAYEEVQQASEAATQAIDDAAEAVDDAKDTVKQAIQDARETADSVTDTAGTVSLWIFVGLLITLAASVGSAYFGGSVARKNAEAPSHETTIVDRTIK